MTQFYAPSARRSATTLTWKHGSLVKLLHSSVAELCNRKSKIEFPPPQKNIQSFEDLQRS